MSTFSQSRKTTWLAGLALAGAVLAGCSPKTEPTASAPAGDPAGANATAPAATDGRIVLISNSTSPFWQTVEKGMEDASRDLNVKVDLIRSDGSVAGQIQKLEQVSAQGDIKGAAVSVIDTGAQGIIDRLNELQKKGVNVITFDSDGPEGSRYAYIGANNVEAGRRAGEALAKLRPQGGKVVAFVGRQSAANARERIQGFKEGAGPKFTLVDVMEDETDPSKARQNVTAAIQAHPEADILLGLWSYNAPAIAEEVVRANKADKYTIVTFDAEPNTINQLQKGVIDATVIQNPYQYGYLSVKLLNALKNNNQEVVKEMVPENRIVDVPVRTVVSDPNGPIKPAPPSVITVAELKQFLDEKGLKGT
ncbi:MAG: substrate-binding domain-containing protein [Armatimonadetes bacterium]|nr:substrate-binding domain-containing protein [Armatimonadota bacterium]